MSTLKICDLHCDSAQLWQAGSSLEDTSLHVSLPHLIEGGVGLQVFAAFVPAAVPEQQRFSFARRTIDRFKEEIDIHSARIVLCRSRGEVEAAVKQGKIAALLAVENGDAIENDLNKLQQLHQMGVRLMTLVHSRSNDWVISSNDKKPPRDGLTGFGVEVVEAMNQLGMIIDVSHAHDRSVKRVLQQSTAPIVASHSCMYDLCPIPRNIKDEMVRGIAAGGGVVGVNFMPAFLDCGYGKIAEKRCGAVLSEFDRRTDEVGTDAAELGRVWMRFTEEYGRTMGSEKVPLEKLLEHVDHLVRVGGEEAAAFGSDFDGIPDTPAGVENCRGFVNILRGLRRRGYSPNRLEKICWSNFMRVLGTVCG
jgi:membrane dipeptidase